MKIDLDRLQYHQSWIKADRKYRTTDGRTINGRDFRVLDKDGNIIEHVVKVLPIRGGRKVYYRLKLNEEGDPYVEHLVARWEDDKLEWLPRTKFQDWEAIDSRLAHEYVIDNNITVEYVG